MLLINLPHMCQQLAKWTMKSLESVYHLDHVPKAYWRWAFFFPNNINHCVKAPIFHAMKSLPCLQKLWLMASITYLTYEKVDVFTCSREIQTIRRLSIIVQHGTQQKNSPLSNMQQCETKSNWHNTLKIIKIKGNKIVLDIWMQLFYVSKI